MIILLLDDNDAILSLACTMIEQIVGLENTTIVTGRNGKEGLQLLEAMDPLPDLIISNFRMPAMDGITFFGAIRSNPRWQHIRLVMMSAITTTEVRRAAAAYNVEAFLDKPFRLDDFRNLLAY